MSTETTNTSQRHGTDWENLIKTAWMFDGACNHYRSGTAIQDIERRFDHRFGLDTAVKAMSVRCDWIGMADATRFCEMDFHRRLIVGIWEQVEDDRKEFNRVHEMILTKGVHRILMRDLTSVQVLRYHNIIAKRGPGKKAADAARADRDIIKEELKGRHHPALRFDFKIDDYEQRRLQVSLSLSRLTSLMEGMEDYEGKGGDTQPLHVIHDKRFCQYPIPIPLLSSPRIITAREKEMIVFEDMLFECEEQHAPKRMGSGDRLPVRRDQMDIDLQRKLFGDV